MRKIVFTACLVMLCTFTYAADTLVIHSNESKLLYRRFFTQLEDPRGDKSFDQVRSSKNFHQSTQPLPLIIYGDSVVWLKFVLHNRTGQPYLPVAINSGVIDGFDMYYVTAAGHVLHLNSLGGMPTSRIISLPIFPDSLHTIYLRIKSNESMVIPVTIQSADIYLRGAVRDNLVLGFFLGIVLIMLLYNLMLFVIVKDISYLYYVFYILFLGFSQW